MAEEVQVDLRRAAHSEKVDIPLYVKLRDDPNLIYGRDFDDETDRTYRMSWERWVDITIRGKVISMETREIT